LENLRSALDYLAHEAHDRHGVKVQGKKPPKIYFPIWRTGSAIPPGHGYKSFADWVNKKQIPGLNDKRADIVNLLESFQEHKDPFKERLVGPTSPRFVTGQKHADLDPSTENRRAMDLGRRVVWPFLEMVPVGLFRTPP